MQAKSGNDDPTDIHITPRLRVLLPVCQVGGHDEVVLDNEASLLGVQDEPLDHLGRHQPLLGVQVGAIKLSM